MSPSLAADLASILKQAPGSAAAALERRLALEQAAPSLAEFLELGSRAKRHGASDSELLLAVATLLALYAPRAEAVRR